MEGQCALGGRSWCRKGITVRRSTEVLAIHHEPTRRVLQFVLEIYRLPPVADGAVMASGLPRRNRNGLSEAPGTLNQRSTYRAADLPDQGVC